jgi:Na+-driven multidrug efflux pump
MGIKGAAYATIISQMVALAWQLYIFSDKRELLHLRRGTYRLSNYIVRNIVAIGMSPFASIDVEVSWQYRFFACRTMLYS